MHRSKAEANIRRWSEFPLYKTIVRWQSTIITHNACEHSHKNKSSGDGKRFKNSIFAYLNFIELRHLLFVCKWSIHVYFIEYEAIQSTNWLDKQSRFHANRLYLGDGLRIFFFHWKVSAMWHVLLYRTNMQIKRNGMEFFFHIRLADGTFSLSVWRTTIGLLNDCDQWTVFEHDRELQLFCPRRANDRHCAIVIELSFVTFTTMYGACVN